MSGRRSAPSPSFPQFRLASSRYLRARNFNVTAVRLSAMPPFSRNMNGPVFFRRVGEDFGFVHGHPEPDG